MNDRPLNPDKPYYTWGEYKGRLCIQSECCADTFSEEEEIVLRDWLIERHPIAGMQFSPNP